MPHHYFHCFIYFTNKRKDTSKLESWKKGLLNNSMLFLYLFKFFTGIKHVVAFQNCFINVLYISCLNPKLVCLYAEEWMSRNRQGRYRKGLNMTFLFMLCDTQIIINYLQYLTLLSGTHNYLRILCYIEIISVSAHTVCLIFLGRVFIPCAKQNGSVGHLGEPVASWFWSLAQISVDSIAHVW